MQKLNKDFEEILAVVSVIENETEAKNIVDVFLIGRSQEERENLLTELELRDSRFLGWDSQYKFVYTSKSISGDALYLKRIVSDIIKSGNYEITLTLKEIL